MEKDSGDCSLEHKTEQEQVEAENHESESHNPNECEIVENSKEALTQHLDNEDEVEWRSLESSGKSHYFLIFICKRNLYLILYHVCKKVL